MRTVFGNIFTAVFFLGNTLILFSQENKTDSKVGFLSLGVRNSIGFFFTEGKIFTGTSVGGQFGLRITENLNSHWFGDYIITNFSNLAQRADVHGGFSMMPNVFARSGNHSRISAFPLAGFCIDYTKISVTNGKNVSSGPSFAERYSFATQFGLGVHTPISERLDFSLETHYMLHIGTDIDLKLNNDEVEIIKNKGTNLEGHLLFAASIEYKLFRLWERRCS